MRIDPKALVAPAVALLVLVLVTQQTMSALQSSGAWKQVVRAPKIRPVDPYANLDATLSRPLLVYAPEGKRDPFGYAAPQVASVVRPRPVHDTTPSPPPAPPRPVLTSIIFDNDPRATIRFNNRDFSVRENSLFADFRVKSITANQVTLESNGGEALVLTLRSKGE